MCHSGCNHLGWSCMGKQRPSSKSNDWVKPCAVCTREAWNCPGNTCTWCTPVPVKVGFPKNGMVWHWNFRKNCSAMFLNILTHTTHGPTSVQAPWFWCHKKVAKADCATHLVAQVFNSSSSKSVHLLKVSRRSRRSRRLQEMSWHGLVQRSLEVPGAPVIHLDRAWQSLTAPRRLKHSCQDRSSLGCSSCRLSGLGHEQQEQQEQPKNKSDSTNSI